MGRQARFNNMAMADAYETGAKNNDRNMQFNP